MGGEDENRRETRPGSGAAEHYWEDPVYRYVSRRHRSAVAAGEEAEAGRFDALMQQLAAGAMPDDLYQRLDAEAGQSCGTR